MLESVTMEPPYRAPASSKRTDVPESLAVRMRDGQRARWAGAIYAKLAVTGMVCSFVWNLAPLATVPAVLLGLFWASRSLLGDRRITFRVDGLRVRVERDGKAFDVELDELLDVRLDTKIASKNVAMARPDGANSVFGAASKHNIEIDVSRIELVLDEEVVILDREFVSATLARETMREIRLFLRAHGWKPADERAGSST